MDFFGDGFLLFMLFINVVCVGVSLFIWFSSRN